MLPRVLSRGAETPPDVARPGPDRLDHRRRRRRPAPPTHRDGRRAGCPARRRSSGWSPGFARGSPGAGRAGPHPPQLPHPDRRRRLGAGRQPVRLHPQAGHGLRLGVRRRRGLRRRLVGVLLHDQQRQELVPAGQLPGRLVEGRQLVVLRRQGPLLPRLQRRPARRRAPATAPPARATTGAPAATSSATASATRRSPATARSCAAWSAARRRGSSTRPAPPPAPPTTRRRPTPHRASPTTPSTNVVARPGHRQQRRRPPRDLHGRRRSTLQQSWQLVPNGGWSGLAGRGVSATGTPAVARNLDGRMEAFVVGADGVLRNSWQLAPNGQWSRLHRARHRRSSRRSPVARRPATPTAGSRCSPSTANGTLMHTWQTEPGSTWTLVVAAARPVGRRARGRRQPGRPPRAVHHRHQRHALRLVAAGPQRGLERLGLARRQLVAPEQPGRGVRRRAAGSSCSCSAATASSGTAWQVKQNGRWSGWPSFSPGRTWRGSPAAATQPGRPPRAVRRGRRPPDLALVAGAARHAAAGPAGGRSAAPASDPSASGLVPGAAAGVRTGRIEPSTVDRSIGRVGSGIVGHARPGSRRRPCCSVTGVGRRVLRAGRPTPLPSAGAHPHRLRARRPG